jgi:hypothetical protein
MWVDIATGQTINSLKLTDDLSNSVPRQMARLITTLATSPELLAMMLP